MELGLFQPLAIAFGLGLLVGMQREWTTATIAGIRTFPLITVLGTVAGILADAHGGWVLAAALLSLAVVLFLGNLARFQQGAFDAGITTEVAALVMFSVGALLAVEHTMPAIAIGGAVAVLLHWKEPLHRFVGRIGADDFTAVMQLVLISLVILPVLPNQTFGWYDVLNPFQVWLIVVLIMGISLSAYVLYKLLGARVGAALGGVLGGMISSTATTVSYARRAGRHPDATPTSALVILVASTIVNVRLLVEIGVVAPQFLPIAAAPIGMMMGLMTLLCVGVFLWVGQRQTRQPAHENPAQFTTALVFGGLYALILLAVAAAEDHFGDQGMYVVAAIAGLANLDAITLSTAELVRTGHVASDTGWRIILLAALSNLMFKGIVVALFGSRKLLLSVSILFGISLAGGGVILLFWPY